MTIPGFQDCMRPALALLNEQGTMKWRAVKDTLADHFELSDEERAQMLPSGGQRLFDNRVAWALTHLVQAGAMRRPQRGFVEITPRGAQLLASSPREVGVADLRAFDEYVEFRQRTRAPTTLNVSAEATNLADELQETPAALLSRAVTENRAALQQEVLDRALALSPIGFEDLVITLLERMGYGQAGSVERTSSTGDAGVDGIISQDPLGLDRIYVQAKRYAADNVIHRPKIHEFAGALLGKQGDRGVYITTSSFSIGALQEADRINARIELIDGKRLAELLVRYRVGVQVEQVVELFRMDEDFYEGL